jgi:hypothetical protein
MVMRRLSVGLMAVGVAACLVGCGSSGDYSSPKATYQTMVKAAQSGSQSGVLACYTEASRKGIEQMDKAQAAVAKLLPGGKQAGIVESVINKVKSGKIDVGKEQIAGDQATLEVTSNGRKESVSFARERGGWFIREREAEMLGGMLGGLEKLTK